MIHITDKSQSFWIDKKRYEKEQKNLSFFKNVIATLSKSKLFIGEDLEKLKKETHQKYLFYSIRFGQEFPLILTYSKIQNIYQWCILAEQENHQYIDSDSSSSSSDSQPIKKEITTIELEYFNHEYIQLSPEQHKALDSRFPLIIRGTPGSGKSCLALLLLRNKIFSQNDETTTLPFLYITQSAKLVNHIKKIWLNSIHDKTNTADIHFKSYKDLIKKENVIVMGEKAFNVFSDWFDQYLSKVKDLKQDIQQKLTVKLPEKDPREFYPLVYQ
ncbi:MAG: hypothetical protein ACOVOR_00430 [Rhabdochlamydiaceae bacterium]